MAPSRRAELGAAGEQAAADVYVAAGYAVRARNWRCREGEIDLVLERPGEVVICEVKTRSTSAYGLPAEAVTAAKQRRLRHLAVAYLAEHPARGAALRFDVAAVMGTTVTIIEHAF